MENILVLDTETTGLNTPGQVLEIAAVLYDIPSRSTLYTVATLLTAKENPAFSINKISQESLNSVKANIQNKALDLIKTMMIDCDAIVAHNAEFDKRWVETIPELYDVSINKKWICSKNDVTWPVSKNLPLNLLHIAAALGVPIVNVHRALSDVHLLVGAISRVKDLDEFFKDVSVGKKRYIADVDYHNRQLAKDAGFQWDKVKAEWYAYLSEEDAASIPFIKQ
jgi:DNA polymerase-3 subunit epsilon